jgi:mannose-1-phosphate guanylyltransferase
MKYNNPEMNTNHRWAVVLAGGDGARLRSLTRMLAGDERPKQFCTVIGNETLLQQTARRIGSLIPHEQTLVVINKNHRHYVESQIPELSGRLILQPENRGTAPAILNSLLSLHRSDPGARVALFPSDHYFTDDAAFMRSVRSAFAASEQRPDMVVLLGIAPDHPEVDYGWIQPGRPLPGVLDGSLLRVDRFWEKPAFPLAEDLFARGCLWNSFVLIGAVERLLRLVREAVPELYRLFELAQPYLGTPAESEVLTDLYTYLEPVDFCGQVLSAYPEELTVLPVHHAGRVDLGRPERALAARKDVGERALATWG